MEEWEEENKLQEEELVKPDHMSESDWQLLQIVADIIVKSILKKDK